MKTTSFILLLFLSKLVFAEAPPCFSEIIILDESKVDPLISVTNKYIIDEASEDIIIEISTERAEGFSLDSIQWPEMFPFEMGLGTLIEESDDDKKDNTFKWSFSEEPVRPNSLREASVKIAVLVKSRDHLAPDKHMHFVVGAGISEISKHAIRGFLPKGADGDRLASIIAFGVTSAVGIAKEVRDTKGHGTPEIADALWTSAGSGLSLIKLNYRF